MTDHEKIERLHSLLIVSLTLHVIAFIVIIVALLIFARHIRLIRDFSTATTESITARANLATATSIATQSCSDWILAEAERRKAVPYNLSMNSFEADLLKGPDDDV